MAEFNSISLTALCADICDCMGIEPPKEAETSQGKLKALCGEKPCDRVVMYNPDAVAQWVYEKYPQFFKKVKENTDLEVPLRAAMPSVTPVCFGTMYTGAQPSVHGIRKYEKPVITIDTIFDSLVRAGKKAAIITYKACSLSRIFLGRNVDYYHFEEGDIAQVNAKAAEVILRDEHDFIVIYNGNYDSVMHKKGPESIEALGELAVNCHMFTCISELVKAHWKQHNTLLGFAMDHGCHEIDGDCGSHGLDMPEDLNITHFYKGYKAQ